MSTWQIRPAGDSALVVELEARVDPTINTRAIALAEAVRAAGHDGVRDVVSTYCSVTIYVDPVRTDVERLTTELSMLADTIPATLAREGQLIQVPIVYGGEYGPDLQEVAEFGKCTEEEVVTRHSAPNYRVYMLGFLPGFAYLGQVDARIAMPRRTSPRLKVPTGSVGIAGAQTGVYPVESPGGWRLIGRTPLKPFDAARAEPFLFRPGDTVRFEPIDERDFLHFDRRRP